MPLPQFQPLPVARRPVPFDHPDWIFEPKHDGYNSQYATSGTIDNGVGSMSPVSSGSTTVEPTATTTYTLTVSGNGESATCSAKLTVTAPAMTVSPTNAEVYTLGTAQFTAGAPANWSVDGGDTNGTIDANGKYTAPAIHPAVAAVTVRATSQADSTRIATASVKVKFGNGTLTWDFDPVFPSEAPNFYAIADPEQSATCGTPSDSATVKVLVDRSQIMNFFTPDQTSPSLTLVGAPGDKTVDLSSWRSTSIHERTHAMQNSLLLQTFLTVEMREGFAETCRVLTSMRLTQKGTQVGYGGNLHFMMVMDSAYRRFTPAQLVGAAFWTVPNSLYAFGQAALTMQATAMAPANTTAGDWPKYGLAPWIDGALYPAMNAKQGPLTRTEMLATFDATKASIDGQSAGTWMGSLLDLADEPKLGQGTTLSSYAYTPVNPTYLQAWLSTIDAKGVHQETGSVTFHVIDASGNEVLTVSGTVPGGASAPPEMATLPYGAYTLKAEVTFNGKTYTDASVFAVVPPNHAPKIDVPISAPGMYFISVDANGNATNAAPQVTSGHLVWAGPGVAIVDANPANVIPATVTVNGRRFTQPRPWTRVIPFQAN